MQNTAVIVCCFSCRLHVDSYVSHNVKRNGRFGFASSILDASDSMHSTCSALTELAESQASTEARPGYMALSRVRQVSLAFSCIGDKTGTNNRSRSVSSVQLLDRLSVKAIFNRLDKRKLQNEIDTHKLFLVTSHHDRLAAGPHKPLKWACATTTSHKVLLCRESYWRHLCSRTCS